MQTHIKTSLRYCAALVCFCVSLNLDANHPRLDTIRERIENWSYPSVFNAWGGPRWRRTLNKPDYSDYKTLSLHDVHLAASYRGVSYGWDDAQQRIVLQKDDFKNASFEQRLIIVRNPNMVFLTEVEMVKGDTSLLPLDSPYWLRDDRGNRIRAVPASSYLMDYTNPGFQEILVRQAVDAAESGLFDGIFFDSFLKGLPDIPEHKTDAARETIVRRIREETHPDFLIAGNTNMNVIPRFAPYVNGTFMETWADRDDGYSPNRILKIESALRWAVENLREPRIICLEGASIHPRDNPDALDSPRDLQWMRLFTTMGLVHSNGSVLYAAKSSHTHFWYDFWDADLGRPVSPKSQLVEGMGRNGCFIREYDNGWTVHNRSTKTQVITLPDVTVAVSTGKYDYIHKVQPMDGDIFLKSHPTSVSPRGLISATWGAIKLRQRGK